MLFSDAGLSTRKQNTGDVILQIPSLLSSPTSHCEVTNTDKKNNHRYIVRKGGGLWCFNNICVISWRSVLLMEETGVHGENHRPVVRHWPTLSILLYQVHLAWWRFELAKLVVIVTDCTGSYKSNYQLGIVWSGLIIWMGCITGAKCVRKKKKNKKILYNTTRGRTHLLPFF